jgi:hypothetical protein
VGSNFSCRENKLTSLEGGPQEVGGDYNCTRNDLTSLEGAAKKVGGSFNCFMNPLTSLEGAPEEVGIWFACDAFVTTSLEWNMEGWIEMLYKGNDEAKQLILPFLSVEKINVDVTIARRFGIGIASGVPSMAPGIHRET